MNPTDADKAYLQIKEKIITVELPPGSVIRDAALMTELGLGRTPIREALKKLQSEDLVFVAPRRGMFVADVAITDLQQIYEVRLELEPLGARLAAERISPDLLEELKSMATEYQGADRDDKRQLLNLDRRFHQLVAQAAGNKFLYNEIDKFYNLSVRIWYLAINKVQSDDIDVDAHLELLDAIEGQNCARSADRMRQHIRHFHDTIRLYL